MDTKPVFLALDSQGNRRELGHLPVDALSLGRGLFETILVLSGSLVFAERHLQRITRSAKVLKIADEKQLRCLFEEAAAAAAENPMPVARLRISVFADPGQAPWALVTLKSHTPGDSPLSLTISETRRYTGDPLAAHKTVNYLSNLNARAAARADGFDDALILDSDGNIAETSTANVFFCGADRIITPPLGAILPGVIRAWVFEACASLGIPLEESHVKAEDIESTGGVFATNSIIGVVRVSRIDGVLLDDIRENGYFKALQAAYEAVIA